MTSHINKLVNTITNKSALVIGRENLTKLSNSINKTFLKSKYRDFLKAGNTVQIISKVSRMSLQICSSQNDPNRLILNGAGQIGPEAFNSQFMIETDPKENHLKFRNHLHYIAFDQDVPCVLAEPTTKPKHKSEYIRTRNEFRMHEVIGSDEYFALESVYFPGKYISILADGSIAVSRNKADESTHFCLNVLTVNPNNNGPVIVPASSSNLNISAAVASNSNNNNNLPMTSNRQKEEEAANESERGSAEAAASNNLPDSDQVPPTYSSLYPRLPSSQ